MVFRSIVRRCSGFSKITPNAQYGLVPVLATHVDTNARLHEDGEVNIPKSVDAILKRLKSQLEVLKDADEPTVKAMRQWHDVASLHLPALDWTTAMSAVEHGAHLLERQLEEAQIWGLGTCLPTDHLRKDIPLDQRMEWCHDRMNDMAGSLSTRSKGSALSELVQDMRDKGVLVFVPFDWAYVGVDPLKLSSALQGHTAAPLVLNIVAGAIAHRAGIQGRIGSPQALNSFPSQRAVPGKSIMPSDIPSSKQWCLISGEEAVDASTGQRIDNWPSSLTETPSSSVVNAWIGLIRLAMEAHQRRGESDAVAHWTHILLSLDPLAPEWDDILLDEH